MSESTWPASDTAPWTRIQGCEEPVKPSGWCSLPAGHPLPHMHARAQGWFVVDVDEHRAD